MAREIIIYQVPGIIANMNFERVSSRPTLD